MFFLKLSPEAGSGAGGAGNPAEGSTPPAATVPGSGTPGPSPAAFQGPPLAPGESSQQAGPVDPGKEAKGSTPAPGAKPGEGEPKPPSVANLLAGKYENVAQMEQGYRGVLTENTTLKTELAAIRQAQQSFQPSGTGSQQAPGPAVPAHDAAAYAAYRKQVTAALKEAGSELGDESLKGFERALSIQDKFWQDRFQTTERNQAEYAAQQELSSTVRQFYSTNPVAKEYQTAIEQELETARQRSEDPNYLCDLLLAKARADDIPNIIQKALDVDRAQRGVGAATLPMAQNLMAGPAGGGGAPSAETEALAAANLAQWGRK